MNTQPNTYLNTAKGNILNFVQCLEPSPSEAPYLASVFEKKHVSMRDMKVLLDFLALRVAEKPLEPHQLTALGLSTFPKDPPSAPRSVPLDGQA